MVSAARHTILAPSGNFSNSCRAAFSHDTGRVLRVSAILAPSACPHVVIFDNRQSNAGWIATGQFSLQNVTLSAICMMRGFAAVVVWPTVPALSVVLGLPY